MFKKTKEKKEIVYARVSPEAMRKLERLQKKLNESRAKTVEYLLLNVKIEK